ncbi:MAG: hypothetical protein RL365_1440 [Bacteroidota bacterium]|jgi:hypothetical protein
MGEEWKNERAESEMREGTEAIRLAAIERAKQEEDKKWNEIINDLSQEHQDRKDQIEWVINLMKASYELPVKG